MKRILIAALCLFCTLPLNAHAQEILRTEGPDAYARARALANMTARMQENDNPGLQEARQNMVERGGFPEDFDPQTARFKDGRPFEMPERGKSNNGRTD